MGTKEALRKTTKSRVTQSVWLAHCYFWRADSLIFPKYALPNTPLATSQKRLVIYMVSQRKSEKTSEMGCWVGFFLGYTVSCRENMGYLPYLTLRVWVFEMVLGIYAT